MPIQFSVLADGETELSLKVPGLPTTLLVDGEGNAIGVKVGPANWDSEEVTAIINSQLSVAPKQKNRVI